MAVDARACCLVLLAGCGALVDAGYLGEPLFHLEGQVYTDVFAPNQPIDVGVLWQGESFRDGSPAVRVQTDFPARYRIDLLHPPAEASLQEIDGVRFAVGLPVLYLDGDGDGRPADPEFDDLVGGTYNRAILYVDAEGETELRQGNGEVWIDSVVTPGFQLVRVWQDPCGQTSQNGSTVVNQADGEVALYLGPVWAYFWDWECAAADGGWARVATTDTCPPEPVLEQECTWFVDHPEAARPDGWIADCLYAFCEEIFEG